MNLRFQAPPRLLRRAECDSVAAVANLPGDEPTKRLVGDSLPPIPFTLGAWGKRPLNRAAMFGLPTCGALKARPPRPPTRGALKERAAGAAARPPAPAAGRAPTSSTARGSPITMTAQMPTPVRQSRRIIRVPPSTSPHFQIAQDLRPFCDE